MVGSGINVHGMLQTVAVMMICHRAIYCGLIWSSPTMGGYPIRRVPLTLCPACTVYGNVIAYCAIVFESVAQVCYGSRYTYVVLAKLANVHHRGSTTIVVLAKQQRHTVVLVLDTVIIDNGTVNHAQQGNGCAIAYKFVAIAKHALVDIDVSRAFPQSLSGHFSISHSID